MNCKTIMTTITMLIFASFAWSQQSDSIVDSRDGKIYNTIKIGEQTWLAQNMNYETPGSWCKECEIYGRSYNYKEASRVCPLGWHLPSKTEWDVLTDNAGGMSVVGGNLKSTGTKYWKSPNTGATNKSGFNAIPHGYVSLNGALNFGKKIGLWWTATEDPRNLMEASSFRLEYNNSEVTYEPAGKIVGLSVRCVKD